MDAPDADALLRWAAAATTTTRTGGGGAVAVYEQTRSGDAFGRVMIDNLADRGCPLRSIAAVPTPAQRAAGRQAPAALSGCSCSASFM